MEKGNVFDFAPYSKDEVFETFISNANFKLEKITSRGQKTPEGTWLKQDRDEWVILLKGLARVIFDGDDVPISILPGDYLLIPAHKRHKVEWTDSNIETVWLALHY